MDTILITGVNGYIGSRLARALLKRGDKVVGIDLAADNIRDLSDDPGFHFYPADITGTSMPIKMREVNIVIHCAALVHKRSSDLSRENYFRINHTGTRNVLVNIDAARIQQVIYLSTVSIYGNPPEGVAPGEDFYPRPDDFYGESKLAAENEIRSFSEKYDIPHTILRLAPVYGPGFILNIHKRVYLPGESFFYRIGNGKQRISLCSVNTIADVVISSLHTPIFFNTTLNVMDETNYSINDVIYFFKNYNSHQDKPVLSIPASLPLCIFFLMSLILPGKAEFYRYQFRKISQDAWYSDKKLRDIKMKRSWDLRSTFGEGA